MTKRVTVDYEILERSATSLTSIADALDGAEADRRSVADGLGHAGLAAALTEFTENWNRHRTELVEEIRAVCATFGRTVDAFRQLDQQLSESIAAASNGRR